jgi:hypothetical protein
MNIKPGRVDVADASPQEANERSEQVTVYHWCIAGLPLTVGRGVQAMLPCASLELIALFDVPNAGGDSAGMLGCM